MFNKKNPMRYFSGSTFARLPLYKLAAGGTAVVLTDSIGLGAFAALRVRAQPHAHRDGHPRDGGHADPFPDAEPHAGAGQAADDGGQRHPAGRRCDALRRERPRAQPHARCVRLAVPDAVQKREGG